MARLQPFSSKLDRKIALQVSSMVRDEATGERTKGYTTYAEPWAWVLEARTTRPGEAFEENQRQAEVTKEFVIRYRTDVRVTHRVLYDGRAYDITDAGEMARAGYRRRTWMLIKAKARAE